MTKSPFVSLVSKEFINKRLSLRATVKPPNARIYIAYMYPNNSMVLGTATITKDLLHDFSVRERYRGYGIGSKLLKMILSHEETPDYVRLYARANIGWKDILKQKDLEAFYKRHGFIHTGRISTKHGVEMIYDRFMQGLPPARFNVEAKLLVFSRIS